MLAAKQVWGAPLWLSNTMLQRLPIDSEMKDGTGDSGQNIVPYRSGPETGFETIRLQLNHHTGAA